MDNSDLKKNDVYGDQSMPPPLDRRPARYDIGNRSTARDQYPDSDYSPASSPPVSRQSTASSVGGPDPFAKDAAASGLITGSLTRAQAGKLVSYNGSGDYSGGGGGCGCGSSWKTGGCGGNCGCGNGGYRGGGFGDNLKSMGNMVRQNQGNAPSLWEFMGKHFSAAASLNLRSIAYVLVIVTTLILIVLVMGNFAETTSLRVMCSVGYGLALLLGLASMAINAAVSNSPVGMAFDTMDVAAGVLSGQPIRAEK